MQEINSRTVQHRLINFLLPSWLTLFMYILVSLVLLFIINANQLWNIFFGTIITNPNGVGSITILNNVYSTRFSELFGNVIVVVLWTVVGCLIYIALWLTQNSLVGAKHEIDSSIIGVNKKKPNILHSLVAHYMFFGALSTLTIFSLYIFIFIGLPVIRTIFLAMFLHIDLNSLLSGLAAVLLLALILHVLNMLLKIYSRFWGIYIKGL